jgi:hypothetical protein
MQNETSLSKLRTALGYKPLSRTWAKAEIPLGLAGAGVGLFTGMYCLSHQLVDFAGFGVAGLALFTY